MVLKEFTFSIGETTQTVKLPEEHISDVMEGKHVPRRRRKRSDGGLHAPPHRQRPPGRKGTAR